MSEETWLRGHWMQTYTGRKFYPMAPAAEDVYPEDIAHALSLLCRYNGHVRRFYSVAEHCVHVSRSLGPEWALWGLLHDATEAYVGDMIRPLKLHMPDYRAAEDRVMVAIAERFGLSTAEMPDAVRQADNRVLLDERAALMSPAPDHWSVEDLEPLGVQIGGWTPSTAEHEYLWVLEGLTSHV